MGALAHINAQITGSTQKPNYAALLATFFLVNKPQVITVPGAQNKADGRNAVGTNLCYYLGFSL